MKQLESLVELEEAVQQELAVLFKHSTRCPVSGSAFEEITGSEESFGRLPFYLIKVIEDREVSQHIARRWGIPHQSPQLILLKEGEAIWYSSHFEVTAKALRGQVEKLLSGPNGSVAEGQEPA